MAGDTKQLVPTLLGPAGWAGETREGTPRRRISGATAIDFNVVDRWSGHAVRGRTLAREKNGRASAGGLPFFAFGGLSREARSLFAADIGARRPWGYG